MWITQKEQKVPSFLMRKLGRVHFRMLTLDFQSYDT